MKKHMVLPRESIPNSGRLRSRLGRWLTVLCLVFLTMASTFAIGEYFLLPRLPALMLGKWHVIDGPYEGSTVQFFADGSMESALKAKDTTETIHGTVRVDGLQLRVTTRNSLTGK